MKLTKHTDYAFRVLLYVAVKKNEELSTIKEITHAFDMSRDHVMKIVQKLSKAGFIKALRGKNGGIRLGRPANEIVITDVITLMEATLAPVNCEQPMCGIKQGCKLADILFEAQDKYLSHLKQYSLADLVPENSQTVQLINTMFIKKDAE
ncbi:MAG: Rrf2 family transcriptional regulator [Thiomicrorhabdus sp.]|nr:Rrf2 family transcriptional regulator [Thiomicrorhabdus sp.]